MVRRFGLMALAGLGAPLVAIPLLAATGCSGEPAVVASATDQSINAEELAALRKSARTVVEFRDMVKAKTAERAGSVVVKTQSVADKARPR